MHKLNSADIIMDMNFSFKMKSAFFAAAFLAAALSAQNRPAAVRIDVRAGENKVIKVSWEFPEKTSPAVTGAKVYRATKPFTAYSEIIGDLPLAELSAKENSFKDQVESSADYFYAVIAVTENGDYKIVIPGMNASVRGVHAKIPEAPETVPEHRKSAAWSPELDTASMSDSARELTETSASLRSAPLPLPGTLLGFSGEKTRMSAESKKSAAELGRTYSRKSVPFKSPYFFEEDMFSPDGGDEYTLFETLRAGLAPKKYEESIRLLSEFLSVHRSSESTARAEFYLGESYYFCKDYEMAIRCFLEVQDIFPEISKQWIDSALDLFEIE